MNAKSCENLQPIRFAGELLPQWARLLDVAAGLSGAPGEVRRWFSRFTACSGVDDARTVSEMCKTLSAFIEKNREGLVSELCRRQYDAQPLQILAAWRYALDTMILEAHSRKTCSWIIDGTENLVPGDSDGGDITLRRV